MNCDYSLLRPFDLEAANFGTKAYWFETECVWFGPSGNKFSQPMYAVEHNAGMSYVPASELRAYPLAWVEGRPVYRGDVLYITVDNPNCATVKAGSEFRVVSKGNDEGNLYDSEWFINEKYLTWQKPKTKRDGWVNVYPHEWSAMRRYDSEKEAIEGANSTVIATVRIEWEE